MTRNIEPPPHPRGSPGPTPALKLALGVVLTGLVAGVPDAHADERVSGAESKLRYADCVVERREQRRAVLQGTANKLYAVPTTVREYRLVCEGGPVTHWLAGDPPARLARAGVPAAVEIVLR